MNSCCSSGSAELEAALSEPRRRANTDQTTGDSGIAQYCINTPPQRATVYKYTRVELIALNINFFLLPIKLLPLLNLLICTASSLFSPLVLLAPYLFSPFLDHLYIFCSKNRQSLISLCITSSLESTSCLIPPALHKTPC